jgi:hypothetical protein
MFTSGRSLRTLFLTGLRQAMITNPGEIWKRYRNYFCDDLLHWLRHTTVSFPLVLANPVYDYRLWLLAIGLADLQKGLTDFFLPINVFN